MDILGDFADIRGEAGLSQPSISWRIVVRVVVVTLAVIGGLAFFRVL